MGVDVFFQAIPNNHEILELAKNDDDWLDILSSPFLYFQLTPPRRSKMQTEIRRAKLEEFDMLFKQFLRTFALSLLWGRKWDILAYLLIEKRRNCLQMSDKLEFYKIDDLSVFDERDRLIYRALFGGDLMRSTTNISRNTPTELPRYISAEEVQEISRLFYRISFDDLLEHYSDELMDKAFLYKFHPNQKSNRDSIIAAFVVLRDFYSNVASYKDGLLWQMI